MATEKDTNAEKRKYLSIMFECCNVYSRIYINAEKTAYMGHCPKCMAKVSAKIGPGGTSNRIFRAG